MPKERNQFSKKVEDWGKTKFKPTLKETTTRTSQNPFTKPQKFNDTGGNENCSYNKGFNGNRGRGGNSGRGGFRGSYGNSGRGGNRGRGGRFDGGQGRDRFNGDMNKNDRIKFNHIARDAKPDNATPWATFKDEINYIKSEETQAGLQANMDSEEAKNVIKQRENNYRRLLMEQKKSEITQWEDFGEIDEYKDDNINMKSKHHVTPKETMKIKNKKKNKPVEKEPEHGTEFDGYKSNDPEGNGKRKESHSEEMTEKTKSEEANNQNTKKKNKKNKQFQDMLQLNTSATEKHNINWSNENKRKHSQLEENITNSTATDEAEESSRKKVKKMHKRQNETVSKDETNNDKFVKDESKESKPFMSKDELKNFHANKLSFHQKDTLRRMITKGVTHARGTSFEDCVKNRKYQMACKEKKSKSKKQ